MAQANDTSIISASNVSPLRPGLPVTLAVHNAKPLAGGRFIGGQPAEDLVRLDDKKRRREINKLLRRISCGAECSGAFLSRGCEWPSGHPMSPQHERKYIQGGIEAARFLLGLMSAADDYLATLPEPELGPTVQDVLSWPDVTAAIHSAIQKRAPRTSATSPLSIVES